MFHATRVQIAIDASLLVVGIGVASVLTTQDTFDAMRTSIFWTKNQPSIVPRAPATRRVF